MNDLLFSGVATRNHPDEYQGIHGDDSGLSESAGIRLTSPFAELSSN